MPIAEAAHGSDGEDWLRQPIPALGGACPAEYMATPDDRALVEALIMRMQSGPDN